MPRLGNKSDLGIATPRGAGAVSVYKGTDVADAGVRMGAQLQQIAAEELANDDALDVANAKALFLRRQSELTRELEQSGDWRNYDRLYDERIETAREEAMGLITSARAREAFGANVGMDIERGRNTVADLRWAGRKDEYVAKLESTLDNARRAALDASTEALRTEAINSAGAAMQRARDGGYIDDVQHGRTSREWANKLALGRLDMLSPAEQLDALNKDLGKALSPDQREMARFRAKEQLRIQTDRQRRERERLENEAMDERALGIATQAFESGATMRQIHESLKKNVDDIRVRNQVISLVTTMRNADRGRIVREAVDSYTTGEGPSPELQNQIDENNLGPRIAGIVEGKTRPSDGDKLSEALGLTKNQLKQMSEDEFDGKFRTELSGPDWEQQKSRWRAAQEDNDVELKEITKVSNMAKLIFERHAYRVHASMGSYQADKWNAYQQQMILARNALRAELKRPLTQREIKALAEQQFTLVVTEAYDWWPDTRKNLYEAIPPEWAAEMRAKWLRRGFNPSELTGKKLWELYQRDLERQENSNE